MTGSFAVSDGFLIKSIHLLLHVVIGHRFGDSPYASVAARHNLDEFPSKLLEGCDELLYRGGGLRVDGAMGLLLSLLVLHALQFLAAA